MKQILTLFLLLSMTASVLAESWEKPKTVDFRSCWARSGEVTLNDAADGSQCLRYKGEQDFCTNSSLVLDVQPGEIYLLRAFIRSEGKGYCSLASQLSNGSETIEWVYAPKNCMSKKNQTDFVEIATKFIVPPDRYKVQPRIVGNAFGEEVSIWFKECTIQKVGKLAIPENAPKHTLENAFLKVDFDGTYGTFSVTDKRTGRVWAPVSSQGLYVQNMKAEGSSITFTAVSGSAAEEFTAKITLEAEKPEVVVKVSADPELPLERSLAYPAAFASQPNDRIILPINEGISFPVTEEAPGAYSMITYGGHGLCMGFWGQFEEEFVPAPGSNANAPNQAGEIVGKSGCLAIIETSDDARVSTGRASSDKLLSTQVSWDPQMQKFGYDRVLRLVFLEKAGVTALTKRYRQYADSIGLLVPFTEKVKRNPALKEGIDLLIGAVNIWYFGGDKVNFYAKLQEGGMKKILASAGGSAEEIKKMNEMPGILTSRYDIYQDSMNPANFEFVGKHSDWTSEAWERDELMTNADGDWIRGWAVSQKDKTKPRLHCGVLCDTCAVPYERERVGKELREKPYRARFIDTTTASPWRECYHPKHPCNRTESKKAKMELLGILGSEFNLVTGSETGHEASVPYCDFYEGMMSLGPYRVPDSGRNLQEIWDEAPERVAKYQVGEAYRLPLWELVYHDCTVSYWYWGDYNNKLPQLWEKRDLFNALYGVPPMYLFSSGTFPAIKERILRSCAVAQPVSEKTGWFEMTSFRILSKDRTVQETRFANGVRVTVNFGDLDYVMHDGFVLKAKSSRVQE